MAQSQTIKIDEVEYIRKDSIQTPATNTEGLQYVVIRADRAGVFAGYLVEDNNEIVVLVDCRRIWYWKGAASISQLAVDGVSKPDECKFPTPVGKIKIMGVVENINATEKSRESIEGVFVWQK